MFWLHRRKQREQDLERELRSDLELEAEEQREAGLAPEDAHYAAQRAFGNTTLVKEEVRDMWSFTFVERLMQDLRYAARTLWKTPSFTLPAIVALALGTGATTAVYTVVVSVLLRPLPFPDSDRLVMLWEELSKTGHKNVTAIENYLAWKERNRSFEGIAAFNQAPMNLLGGDGPVQVTGTAVSAEFFGVLRVKPLLGRIFVSGEEGPSAPRITVITYGLWQRRFGGSPDIIGQRISINVSHHEIVGVMPAGFEFPNHMGELFVPLRAGRNSGRNYSAIGRLKPGVTLLSAQADMADIAAQTARESPALNAGWSATVVPLLEQTVGEIRPVLMVLFAVVGFVLLIACANVANLVLMRSATRAREINVRAALGAGRWRLVHQLVVENVLLAAVGGLVGIVLAHWPLRSLLLTLPATFPLPRLHEISIDSRVLLIAIGISVSAGFLFGLAPALQLKGLDLAGVLRHSGRNIASSSSLRRLLVIAEVALSFVLVIGAGLMVRSLVRLSRVDPGFYSEHVLTARMLLLPVRDRGLHAEMVNEILRRVRSLPGIQAAGSIGVLPMTGGNSGTWYYRADGPAPPLSERPGGDVSIITPGYFQALGIPVLGGRDFDERDRAGSPKVAILNRNAARMLFGNENPLGKRVAVSWNDALEAQIVGVVADIRHSDLHFKPDPCLFLPNAQQPFPSSSLVIRTLGDPLSLAKAITDEIRHIDSDQGVSSVESMHQLVADSLARPRLQALLFGMFGLLAATLACIGIYAVISYSVVQRTREIGIRMALGATQASILGSISAEGLRLTGVGLAIGLAAALGMTRYLRSLLFEVEPTDPLVFVGVLGVITIVAATACYIPSSRATRLDPGGVLRDE